MDVAQLNSSVNVGLRRPVPRSATATARGNRHRFGAAVHPGLCNAVMPIWVDVSQRIILHIPVEIPALWVARVLIATIIGAKEPAHS